MQSKYQILLRVLDQLRMEAPVGYTSYRVPTGEPEAINYARSKAYIHLLLKVYFGVLEFSDREKLVTDGDHDGGIDAYFIDRENRTIYFIQSKFRTTEENFENKSIEAEELLKMDLSRILKGYSCYDNGQSYNSKIIAMINEIGQIDDIGRYKYQVLVLANARKIVKNKLDALTDSTTASVIDANRCYEELVLPLISGDYYKSSLLRLSLNLSDKNAGSKINYSVCTASANCEVTVLFVPIIEIAKSMYKYRNAILKYNPRSYLSHEGEPVNQAIRASVESRTTNEFAVFNNGITFLSEETNLNERIGRRDSAQIVLKNPQIINGGQTAYTLAIIYSKAMKTGDLSVFHGKEVLCKVITIEPNNLGTADQIYCLINDISRATNRQSTVSNADRLSNTPELVTLRSRVFNLLGIFLERKRGEFEDGIREGYLQPDWIIRINIFLRALYAASGDFRSASKKKLTNLASLKRVAELTDTDLKRAGFAAAFLHRSIVRHDYDFITSRRSGELLFKCFLASKIWFQDKSELVEFHQHLNFAHAEIGKAMEFLRSISACDQIHKLGESRLNSSVSSPLSVYVKTEDFANELEQVRSKIHEV